MSYVNNNLHNLTEHCHALARLRRAKAHILKSSLYSWALGFVALTFQIFFAKKKLCHPYTPPRQGVENIAASLLQLARRDLSLSLHPQHPSYPSHQHFPGLTESMALTPPYGSWHQQVDFLFVWCGAQHSRSRQILFFGAALTHNYGSWHEQAALQASIALDMRLLPAPAALRTSPSQGLLGQESAPGRGTDGKHACILFM
jgi:hypothetical protein